MQIGNRGTIRKFVNSFTVGTAAPVSLQTSVGVLGHAGSALWAFGAAYCHGGQGLRRLRTDHERDDQARPSAWGAGLVPDPASLALRATAACAARPVFWPCALAAGLFHCLLWVCVFQLLVNSTRYT